MFENFIPNVQLIEGMFPYMMIAVMPIFSAPDWPKSLLKVFQKWTKSSVSITKEQKSEKNPKNEQNSEVVEKSTKKQKLTLLLVLVYILIQLFLPHSHWVTKGYNTWTNGLYGYSWDMMVHNWKHIHTRVTVIDESMRKFYINPEAWTRSVRWVHHSDMVKQFANCAQKHLYNDLNITNPSIYVDAWISLNGRFAQRVYDPRIDIVKAEWSPFKKPDWVLPLLTQLTDWRQKLKQVEESIYEENNYTSVIFIADFPGFHLCHILSELKTNHSFFDRIKFKQLYQF
jgi:vitamin K-dependent gamma-carboxylase